jgi:hypothetical protein
VEVLRYIKFGGGEETIFPILKVPRQCSLILMVKVMHMIRIIFKSVGRAAV